MFKKGDVFIFILAISLIIFVVILLINSKSVRNFRITSPTTSDMQSTSGNPATRCANDSDCVIKISIDCCSGYARCFNKDYKPDFEHFKKACREGMPPYSCEHKEVESCKCQNSYCKTTYK